MNINVASAFPLSKEWGASAKVAYEFQLDDPGTEVPLHVGLLAGRRFFPPALTDMLTLGNDLPVQISRLGPPSKDWRQPRPVTESLDIAAFNPQALLEILRPGDEVVIGMAIQAAVNGQAINYGKPLKKNLLVRRGSYGSSLNTVRVAELENLKDSLERPNIFNVIGRSAGVIHPKKDGEGKVIGIQPYSASEYFGWPVNAGDRNRVVDDKTYQVRHLGKDLFLGGELVLEPVVEAVRGPAEAHENGTLVGYDLIAIGWGLGKSGRTEVQSQILQEFRG